MHIHSLVLMTVISTLAGIFIIDHTLLVRPGSGYQAPGALVTRNEEQPIQVCKLHPASAVSHAGQ